MTGIASFLVLFLVFAARSGLAAAGSDVAYQTRYPLGVKAHVVIVDLNSPSISIEMALPSGGVGGSETFGSIVSRTKPIAAITGTFFCTQSLIPVGDIVMNGRRVNVGAIGSGILFTPDNKVKIIPAQKGKAVDWTGCATGLRAGPQLVVNGDVSINAYREGFRDRSLFGRRVRAAIGVTKHNKLLLVAVKTPVTLTELAKVMRALGAVEAVNLDGGSSTALSYGGKVMVQPGRRMTNVIAVTRRDPMPIVKSPDDAPPAVRIVRNLSEPLPIGPILSHSSHPNTAHQHPTTNTQAITPEHYALLPEGPARRETR